VPSAAMLARPAATAPGAVRESRGAVSLVTPAR
jgi:hypothetical protein